MIDRANASPKYWEKVLQNEMLGEKQLGLKDSDIVEDRTLLEAKPTMARRKSDDRNKDLAQLRHVVDKNDQFFEGHQINKTRTREKGIPSWATDNKETQALLLRAFPKLKTNAAQRKRAARWATVITLFYRMNLSNSQVAAELRTTVSVIDCLLQRMRHVAKGLQSSRPIPRKVKKAR